MEISLLNKLPKDIFNKIFLMYLQIKHAAIRDSFTHDLKYRLKFNSIYYFSDYYNYPCIYIHNKWKYIKHNISDIEIIQTFAISDRK